ncbi:hypothetical protein APSETT444_007112 [Aspergillus pseudonomiae]
MPALSSGWGFCLCRFLVGVAEGPFVPAVSLLTSSWYTKQESPLRMGIWHAGNIISNVFSGLLAAAILTNMDGIAKLRAWQWFILLEGIIVKTLNFSEVVTYLVQAPPYVIAYISTLIISWSSGRTGDHCWHIIGPILVSLAGAVIMISTLDRGARYFSLILLCTGPFVGLNIQISWETTVVPRPRTKRAALIAIANCVSSVSHWFTPYFFLRSQEPRYRDLRFQIHFTRPSHIIIFIMGSIAHPAYTLNNPFRTRILNGQITPLMSIKFVTGNEIPMMCKMAGVHAMFIDMEHSALDMRTVAQLILACNYAGVSPVVRSPSKSHWHISRILDAGAAAVVIPHIETVQEVREIVKHAKFAPLGTRGCTNNQAVMNFQHVPTLVQNEILNEQTMLIPMIETPGAVEIADEIFAVEGVDGVLVGSNDLCTDLGIPGKYDSDLYQDAVIKVIQAANRAGKPVGIGGIGGRLDLLEKWFKMGATWSLSGQDASMLQAGLKQMSKNYGEISERLQKEP